MSNNPFSSPPTVAPPHTDGQGAIRRRIFRVSMMSFRVLSAFKTMQRLRDEAEDFINREIGAANVVSIVEHTGYEYSVVVWFRTE